jgi:hypothetical protein
MNRFLLGLIALTGFVACVSEKDEITPEVCFEQEVLPILVSNCTQSGCHNSQDREADLDLSNYASILEEVKPGNYQASAIYQVIISPFGNKMPPSPYNALSEDQIFTIASWIDQGAKNNACNPVACDTADVRFSTHIKPILEKYCNGCHSGKNPQGLLDLTKFDQVKGTVTTGSLLGSVERQTGFSPMPKGSNKINSCLISQIRIWIDKGALNN